MIKNFEIVDETKEKSSSICINIEESDYRDLIFKYAPKEFQEMYDEWQDLDGFEEFNKKYDDNVDKLNKFYNYLWGIERVDGEDDDKNLLKETLGNAKLPDEISHIFIDYPLSCTVKVNIFGDKTYFDLITDIREAYKCIYDFEENSLKNTKVKYIEGTFNRCKTDGKFGIWGHEIGDLVIESIDILDDGGVNLFIGS